MKNKVIPEGVWKQAEHIANTSTGVKWKSVQIFHYDTADGFDDWGEERTVEIEEARIQTGGYTVSLFRSAEYESGTSGNLEWYGPYRSYRIARREAIK